MTTTKRIDLIDSVVSVRGARAALLATALMATALLATALMATVLAGMAVGLTAAEAEAQEAAGGQGPQLLVSNLGVGLAGSGGIQRSLSAGRPGFAQAFTTGTDTGGYTLGSLGIQVSSFDIQASSFDDASTVGDHLQVTVNGVASGGGPGEALCALTNPWSFSTPGLIVFKAAAGAGACPRLAAGTSYFVVIEWVNPSGTDRVALIPQTYPGEGSAATGEDPGGAEGWSIADQSYYLGVSPDARTWTAFVETASFKIVVKQASGRPTIDGRARVGETLTANTIGIAGADGLSRAVFAYQWARSDGGTDTDIQDATGSSYTLVAADEARTVTVRVSFTDDAGNPQTLSSDATAPVAKANTRATGAPTIDGIAQVGETLTASTSAIADADGLSRAVFAYRWATSDGGSHTDIQGATGSAYTLVAADEARTVTVTVSFTDDAGNPESLPSDPTGEVAAKPNSDATGEPTIDGTARVGETLTAHTAGIADADGLSRAVFAYQWATSDGATDTDIDGATGSAYTLVAADEAKTVTVRVSFTDDAGSPQSLTSESTARVAPGTPPGEPSFSAGEATDRGIELSWNQDGGPGVEHYVVYRRVLPHEELSEHATVAWSGEHRTSFTDAGVHPGLEYLYQVAGVNSAGEGPKSAGVQLTVPGELLEAPTELAAVYTRQGMALKWGAPTNARTTDYWVYRGKFLKDGGAHDGAVSKYVKIRADGSPMTFLDTGVDEGERYRYRIRGVNTLGEGSFTRWLDIDANGSEALADTAATGAPAVTGTAEVGQTLAADTSPIADADGLNNPRFAYQWIRNDGAADADIDGATGSTHTLAADDEGKTIKVTVSFTDDWSHPYTRTSDPTGEVGTTTSSEPDTVLLGTVQDGGALVLEDPDNDIYGIRLEHDPDGDIDKVALELSYSEHADDADDDLRGGNLPAGSYDLRATVSGEDGEVLGTFKISFTVAEGTPAGDVSAENNAPTGAPTISGTAQVGETLTADTSAIADADGLTQAVFTYQWARSSGDGGTHTAIAAATGSAYTLVADDAGNTITVTVTFTDDAGNPESLPSAATATVAAEPNSDATGAPTIEGTAQVGETLTADTSAIADAEGLTQAVLTYQWARIDGGTHTAIAGATNSAYTLVADDAGKTIEVTVTFTDDANNRETLSSPATSVVAAIAPTQPLNLTVTEGSQIQELVASWQAPASDGGADVYVYQVQWKEAIHSWDEWTKLSYGAADAADGTTYTITGLTGGTEYAVRVLAINRAGHYSPASSEAKGTPAGDVSPENNAPTGAPTIEGTAQVGQTLTANTAAIADADGLTQAVFAYQWARSDGGTHTAIAAATGSAYTLVDADEGTTITVTVTFTDNAGNPETLPSAPTAAVAPKANTQATGAPTIEGTAQVGQTLTASTSAIADEDGLTNPGFAYQWARSNGGGTHTAIAAATSSAYTLTDADEGTTITVTVTFTDNAGNPETLPSTPTAAVAPKANTQATGAPTIEGTAQVGQTLTASTTAIADEDGLTNPGFAYQWARSSGGTHTAIAAATGSAYTLTDADEGTTITVTVTFTDNAGNPETLPSAPTAAVAPKANTQATGAPTIEGTAQVGQTLTANTTAIADADGLTQAVFSYQWARSSGGGTHTAIAAATGSAYTLTDADEGNTITVTVTFTDNAGNPETLPSAPTAAVAPKANTQATGAPTIEGTAQVGQTLTANTTAIADEDGLTQAVFAYQWARSSGGGTHTAIAAATGSTYTLTDADEGRTITVTVTFTDNAGNPETLPSAPTAAVAAKPNSDATGAPTIEGTAQVGQTLTANTSAIADEDGLTNPGFAYQWARSSGGGTHTAIAAATNSAYTLTDADEGRTITVTVTFTDNAGNPETLPSAPTAAVESEAGPLTGFTLVNAADTDQAVLWKHQTDGSTPGDDDTWQEWTHGGTLTLGDPQNGTYGIRADTESDAGIHRVVLELTLEPSGEKRADRTDDAAPYSLHGDEGDDALDGENLPVGSYTLKATAHTEDDEVLGSLEVSFTVAPTVAPTVATVEPDRPQDLEGKASAQGIELAWDAPPGSAVTHYVIYRGELQNGSMNGRPMTRYATIEATGEEMSYTDDEAQAGAEYRYRVAAVNGAGEGKKSNWINIEA